MNNPVELVKLLLRMAESIKDDRPKLATALSVEGNTAVIQIKGSPSILRNVKIIGNPDGIRDESEVALVWDTDKSGYPVPVVIAPNSSWATTEASETGTTDHGELTGLSDDDHTQYANLSQAETITGSWQFAPTSAQAPFTLNANAQGQLVTGLNADKLDGYDASELMGETGAPTTAQYLTLATDGDLSAERVLTPGSGISGTDGGANSTYTLAIQLASPSGLNLTGGLAISDLIAGNGLTIASKVLNVGQGDGITVSTNSIALTTPGTITASTGNSSSGNHTHAITASDNPGASASILKTSASGYLQLVRLGLGVSPSYPLHVSGNAYIAGLVNDTFTLNQDDTSTTVKLIFGHPSDDGELWWTGSTFQFKDSVAFEGGLSFGHMLPAANDTYDIGSTSLLWRKAYISEIDAVLFSQSSVNVQGGWMMIPHSTGTLGADVTTIATRIDFGDNAGSISANDFILLRSSSKVEYVRATSLYSGSQWNVTRNLDGSGADSWLSGQVWINLGYNGDGRIELNAQSGGPKIQVITQGTSYNTQTEHVRLGDLTGWQSAGLSGYGYALGNYSGNEYMYYSSGSGMVIRGTIYADDGQLSSLTVSGTLNISTGGVLKSGATAYNSGTGFWLEYNSGTPRLFIGNSSGNKLIWDGSNINITGTIYATGGEISGNLSIVSGGKITVGTSSDITIDENGIKILNSTYDGGGNSPNTIQWYRDTTNLCGHLYSSGGASSSSFTLIGASTNHGYSAGTYIRSTSTQDAVSGQAQILVEGLAGSLTGTKIVFKTVTSSTGARELQLSDGDLFGNVGLSLGYTSKQATAQGQLRTSSYAIIGGDLQVVGTTQVYRGGAYRTGYLYVPVTEIAPAAWNGVTPPSQGWVTLTSSPWSLPTGIKAVEVQLIVDPGSNSGSCGIKDGNSKSIIYMSTNEELVVNGPINRRLGKVQCNGSGQIYWEVSGLSDATIYLRLYGYYI